MNKSTTTSVAIIGAGPAGLMLAQLLTLSGISCVVLERQSRGHVESRIRAGVLEWGSVETIRRANIGARMDKEGLVHDGFDMAFDGDKFRIDLKGLVDKAVMVYGQTELTKDLTLALEKEGADVRWSVSDVALHDLDSGKPSVTYTADGEQFELKCDFVAACDGYHGVGRKSIPSHLLREYERVYPFGWLGLLADVPPCQEELVYANHQDGFALCSMRSPTRSRYYVQVSNDEKVEDWSDERFWDELSHRIGPDVAAGVVRGTSIEKSIAPLRSFVAEPMNYGRMFLAGDAAHIVPPTGAKGLNMALADVRLLSEALETHYKMKSTVGLENYATRALDRIWKVERFSWMMSELLHQFPEQNPFEKRMQRSHFDYIKSSEAAQKSIAENYVGLPI